MNRSKKTAARIRKLAQPPTPRERLDNYHRMHAKRVLRRRLANRRARESRRRNR